MNDLGHMMDAENTTLWHMLIFWGVLSLLTIGIICGTVLVIVRMIIKHRERPPQPSEPSWDQLKKESKDAFRK